MTFDITEFYEVLSDIEKYLGYLKGNELAYDYLHQAMIATSGTPIANDERIMTVFLDEGYKFPCPEGRFAVKPFRALFRFEVHVPADLDPVPETTPAEWLQEVQRGADESFRNGLSWASGLQWHLSSLCDQIVKPDAFKLNSAAGSMRSSVTSELGRLTGVDWAQIEGLLGNWHGDAKLAFDRYYRGVTSQLYDFTRYTAYACKATYAAVRIIDGTQNGLMSYVKSVRAAIVDQLDEWADTGMEPRDTPKTPQWLVKVEKIAADGYSLLDHVPVVKDVKGQFDAALSIATSVEAIAVDLGWDPPHEEPPFDAKDSDELYTEVTTTIDREFYRKFITAMETQVHGGAVPEGHEKPVSADDVLREMHESMQDAQWQLPEVDGTSIIKVGPGSEYDRNHDGVDDATIYRA